jgi:hypothetical protein
MWMDSLSLTSTLGTFVDALGGWWWARSLGLGDILPIEHVRSSLQNTFQQNHVTAFNPGKAYFTCNNYMIRTWTYNTEI